MCSSARRIVEAHDAGMLAGVVGHGPMVAAARALLRVCEAGLEKGPVMAAATFDPDPPYFWDT